MRMTQHEVSSHSLFAYPATTDNIHLKCKDELWTQCTF